MTLNRVALELDGRQWQADLTRGHDLSIALQFDGPQPSFFSAPPASVTPYEVDRFKGRVNRGSSCNCSTLRLTPHCNGTHTECVGHITTDVVNVCDVAERSLLLARVVSITPVLAAELRDSRAEKSADSDLIIGAAELHAAMGVTHAQLDAIIVRTLPNPTSKQQREYRGAAPAPYFSVEAIAALVQWNISHLIVDLPSIDRADDGGQLLAHRKFWGLAADANSSVLAARPHATITELAFIGDAVVDGQYLLNLQVASFASDAAPSRPIIYPLQPT